MKPAQPYPPHCGLLVVAAAGGPTNPGVGTRPGRSHVRCGAIACRPATPIPATFRPKERPHDRQ